MRGCIERKRERDYVYRMHFETERERERKYIYRMYFERERKREYIYRMHFESLKAGHFESEAAQILRQAAAHKAQVP